jgi:hypothetical protein
MIETEFNIPKKRDLKRAAKLIEEVCCSEGLSMSLKGSLSAYPGCIHWHFKKPHLKGTLELTLWHREGRIWSKVQEGRKAAWIDEVLPKIRWRIEKQCKG